MSGTSAARTVRANVDADGIVMAPAPHGAVDVLFGDRRIWSFSTKDGRLSGPRLTVPWPARLRPRLRGVAEVTLWAHETTECVFRGSVQFGRSTERVELVDELGNPLSVDKNGRLQRSFEQMDDGSRRALVDAARRLTDALVDELGVATYLSYGCLLGAARTGRMIGHDSDIDLAFLSTYEHPFDIIRESRAAERGIRQLGWKVVRLSAANFKVWVPLPNGKPAGVDVFGSFYVGEQFHLTGNLRGPLPRKVLVPFGKIELEGVSFPAPADVERFLSWTYGPAWRIPDPAFHFEHPQPTKDRMNQWLRAGRYGIARWESFYTQGGADRVPTEPSSFATWAADRIEPGSRVVDLGSGTGRDAIWLAGRGFRVIGGDYCVAARRYAGVRAAEAGVDVPFREFNMISQRSVLVRGARLSRLPGATHVYARLLLDELPQSARAGFWRFCSMVCRSGGRTFVEFRSETTGRPRTRGAAGYPSAEAVVAEVARAGGRVVTSEVSGGLATFAGMDPEICRLEVSWT